MLEWKSDYETGVPWLDAQHKVLFHNINLLGKLLDKPEIKRSAADSLLAFLDNYAEQHFNGEETCMMRFRCPAHAENKMQHKIFLDVLRFARGEFEATTMPKKVLEELHETMELWINNHILKTDIQLKGCVGT